MTTSPVFNDLHFKNDSDSHKVYTRPGEFRRRVQRGGEKRIDALNQQASYRRHLFSPLLKRSNKKDPRRQFKMIHPMWLLAEKWLDACFLITSVKGFFARVPRKMYTVLLVRNHDFRKVGDRGKKTTASFQFLNAS